MDKSKFVKNVMFGFGGQLIIIVLGIAVPRIMITSYGSDVNGLISTVTQIFTYMALLEAGIGQAAKNALFKPIAEKNKDEVSYVVSVARRYFRKITVYYGLGVAILSVLAPFLLKTNVDYLTIFLIILLEGMSGVISFYFIQTSSTILVADGKGYVNNGVNLVIKTLSYTVKIIMASQGISVVLLQFVYLLITIARTFFYHFYFDKNYSWIDYKRAPKTAKLNDRNAYIVSEIAWTVFSSSDMIVLSAMVSTRMSSVYGVYNLVFTNLNVLLNAVYSSVNYVLGQTFHEDKEKYIKLHDMYTSVFLGAMTTLMCIAYILIIPFVKLYTSGITDVEYVYSALPIMFCLVQIISWSRYITGNLTAIAGYAKKTSRISVVEALINVVLSVIFVQKWGVVGVLAATVLALPIKVIYCTYLSDKNILRRSCKKSLRILGANYLFFFITVFVNTRISLSIHSLFDFVIWGIVVSLICGCCGVVFNVIANPECVNIINKVKVRRRTW